MKGPHAIKGIQMEGLRVVGLAREVAKARYHDGVDELLLLDVVASLYERDHMTELLRAVTSTCFVPVTVVGGIKSVGDADALFRAGADKIAINSALFSDLSLVDSIAKKYGSQAVVAQIDAKQLGSNGYECYKNGGRERTGFALDHWVSSVINAGVGEILLSSVDMDGTRKGFDVELIKAVANTVPIPVVVSSGAGSPGDVVKALSSPGVAGVAVGAAFHWNVMSVESCREACIAAGIHVREIAQP